MLLFKAPSGHRNSASNKCGMDAMFLIGSVGAYVFDWGRAFVGNKSHMHTRGPHH